MGSIDVILGHASCLAVGEATPGVRSSTGPLARHGHPGWMVVRGWDIIVQTRPSGGEDDDYSASSFARHQDPFVMMAEPRRRPK